MRTAQPAPRAAVVVVPDARLLLTGFLAVQIFLGYEWLMSGLAKVVAGDFAAGLAATLTDATQEQTGWYKSFIDQVVIPNGQFFGYLVMAGELIVGASLIVASLVWLVRWTRLGPAQRVVRRP